MYKFIGYCIGQYTYLHISCIYITYNHTDIYTYILTPMSTPLHSTYAYLSRIVELIPTIHVQCRYNLYVGVYI